MHDPEQGKDELEKRIDQFLGRVAGSTPCETGGLSDWLLRRIDGMQSVLGRMQTRLKKRQARPRRAVQPGYLQELSDHLRAEVEYHQEQGMDADKAWQAAAESFGNPEKIIGDLETIHHVSVVQVVGRLMCLGAALLMFYLLGFRWTYAIGVPAFLAIGIAPLLAALWKPVSFRESPIRFLMPGALFMALLWLSGWMEGGHGISLWCLSFLGMTGSFFWAGTRSQRYLTRQSAYCLWAGFIGVFMGITIVYGEVDIIKFGHGIASTLVAAIYAILMGRPSWRVTVVYSLLLFPFFLPQVSTTSNGMRTDLLPWQSLYLAFFSYKSALLFFMALALGWAVGAGRSLRDWLPAGAFLAMVFELIRIMGNLSDVSIVLQSINSARLVFVLSVLLILGNELRRFWKTRKRGEVGG